MSRWKLVFWFALNVLREFGEDRASHMAAAISYYVLFSLPPLLTFVAIILSLFMDADKLKETIVDRVLQVAPLTQDEGANVINDIVDHVLAARGSISIISLFLIIWGARAMFAALRTAINTAWGVSRPRPFLQQVLWDIAMVIGVGLLLLLSLGSTMLLQVAARVTDELGFLSDASGFFWNMAFYLLPALFSFLAFTVVYWWVPNVPVRWSEAMLGAAVAAVLFELAKNLFALYLRNFGNYEATYGALAGVATFLFWTYISAAIALLGAEVVSEYNRVHHGEYAMAEAPGPPAPEQSWQQKVVGFLKGLAVHDEAPTRRDRERLGRSHRGRGYR